MCVFPKPGFVVQGKRQNQNYPRAITEDKSICRRKFIQNKSVSLKVCMYPMYLRYSTQKHLLDLMRRLHFWQKQGRIFTCIDENSVLLLSGEGNSDICCWNLNYNYWVIFLIWCGRGSAQKSWQSLYMYLLSKFIFSVCKLDYFLISTVQCRVFLKPCQKTSPGRFAAKIVSSL